jgi:hypothetical protein
LVIRPALSAWREATSAASIPARVGVEHLIEESLRQEDHGCAVGFALHGEDDGAWLVFLSSRPALC